MNKPISEEQFKRRLLGNLANAGSRALKISKKQELKLREWIVPSLTDKFGVSSEPLPIVDIRKYIDEWESVDLNEKSHAYYYVEKNSAGKSFYWDHRNWILLAVGLVVIILYALVR